MERLDLPRRQVPRHVLRRELAVADVLVRPPVALGLLAVRVVPDLTRDATHGDVVGVHASPGGGIGTGAGVHGWDHDLGLALEEGESLLTLRDVRLLSGILDVHVRPAGEEEPSILAARVRVFDAALAPAVGAIVKSAVHVDKVHLADTALPVDPVDGVDDDSVEFTDQVVELFAEISLEVDDAV